MKQTQSKTGMFERIMMAITFAEAGEHDTALDYLEDRYQNESRQQLETTVRRKESRPRLRAD